MPEQPVVRTPRRRPTPLPRLAMKLETCLAAFSVSVTGMATSGGSLRRGGRALVRSESVLGLVIGDGGFDRILCQDGAMDFNRRQRQFLCDLGILDAHRLIEGLAFHP